MHVSDIYIACANLLDSLLHTVYEAFKLGLESLNGWTEPGFIA